MTALEKQKFGEMYEDLFPKIYKFFYYRSLSKEIAEDLTTEVFIRAAKLFDGEINVDSQRPYVYGIARNIFLDYLKRKYRLHQISLTAEMMEVLISKEESDSQEITPEERLESVLPYISKKQQIVVRMRFLEKLSPSEIAEALGKDKNYVKVTQRRALASIRRVLSTRGLTDDSTPTSTKLLDETHA